MLSDVEYLLTEQPNSGDCAPSSDIDNLTVERVYRFAKVYYQTIKDALMVGDTGLVGSTSPTSDGYVIDWNFRMSEAYPTLTIKFSQRPPNGLFPAINIKVLTAQHYLDVGQGNIPLWQVPGYLTNWNYNLAARNGVTATPDWWETTDTLVISAADAVNYRWISEPTQALSGWYIIEQKTKPGVNEKLSFDASVREEMYVRTYEEALGALWNEIKVYETSTMETFLIKTYGYTGQWLVTPSTVSPEGDLIRITTLFRHADSWDEDIYGEAT